MQMPSAARRRGTPVSIVAAVLVAAVAVGAAGDDEAAGRKPARQILELIGTPTSFRVGGQPAAGEQEPGPGAFLVFTESLARRGRRVAGNTGTCTVVTAARLQCSITTTLAGGTLQVEG